MEMTQEELDRLIEIKNEIKRDLKENQKYVRLITRKEQILNYLITIQEEEEKKKQIKEYEEIGNEIKEIEFQMAFKIATKRKTKEKKKIMKGIKKKEKINLDKYSEQFNKIIEDSDYKEKTKIHNEIFQILTNTNKEERDLLFKLESIETEIATIETEKIQEYIEK